ncbi:hypothetical protein [Pseudorhodobacter sp.]|uniref:NYN domain-containing protein n=1 Tax=Pseudorhodobacter sp. TaxID=1934400 RepID=UPI00264741FF|nr:hypothetical protein [Pseudorhodobacter sp.]MDN5786610.1 hypothetical protein [Pseudorhodobacter sp.]
MNAPVVLLILSVFGMGLAWNTPDLLLLAGLCAVASLVLVGIALIKRASVTPKAKRDWIVIDGSNVMYWQDRVPKLVTVREAVLRLEALGFAICVVFDANAGHLLAGRYMHDDAFAMELGLEVARVLVVPKGAPADPYILKAARGVTARIVTNDRYRDWVPDFPEVAQTGHLIRGGVRDGVLWLDLPGGGIDTQKPRKVAGPLSLQDR